MIQRIQTIFIILCAILFSLFLFLPLKEIHMEGANVALTALSGFNTQFSYTMSFSLVSGFVFLGIACSIGAIFAFKQRYLQIRLCYILIILAAACLLLIDLTHSVDAHSNAEVLSIPANAFLGGIIVFGALAIVYIKKDINLLKKADRIR